MTVPISRRRFVQQIALYGGAILILPLDAAADTPSLWISLGPAGKFKKGSVTQIELPGSHESEVISVSHRADDTFVAFSARCTHRGCIVDWDSHHRQFVCPCHGGRFDEMGKNITGPPRSPLGTLVTRVDAQGILQVQLPQSKH